VALGNPRAGRTIRSLFQTEVLFGQLANKKVVEGLSFPLKKMAGQLFIRPVN